jgi:hypothetical protein
MGDGEGLDKRFTKAANRGGSYPVLCQCRKGSGGARFVALKHHLCRRGQALRTREADRQASQAAYVSTS